MLKALVCSRLLELFFPWGSRAIGVLGLFGAGLAANIRVVFLYHFGVPYYSYSILGPKAYSNY